MMLGIQRRECISLQDICGAVITSCMKQKEHIDQLEIPQALKQFLSDQFPQALAVAAEHLISPQIVECTAVNCKTYRDRIQY